MDTYSSSQNAFILSKSSYIKGMQCLRYLYLNKYRPQAKTPHSPDTLSRFKSGRSFESAFRTRFPDAVDVSRVLGKKVFSAGVTYTQELLRYPGTPAIFEACFIHQGVLVMTDILVKNEDNSYTVYEIKNASIIKEVFLWDLSLQYFICRANLKDVRSFNLVLRDEAEGYRIIDFTESLEQRVHEVKENIAIFTGTLNAPELPYAVVDEHCLYPYKCEFLEYCQRQLF